MGLDGEYTNEITLVHEQAQQFWSDSGVNDDINLLCVHGTDLADSNNLIPTLEILFQKDYNDEYTVYDHEKDIQQLIQRLHGRGFNLYASFR